MGRGRSTAEATARGFAVCVLGADAEWCHMLAGTKAKSGGAGGGAGGGSVKEEITPGASSIRPPLSKTSPPPCLVCFTSKSRTLFPSWLEQTLQASSSCRLAFCPLISLQYTGASSRSNPPNTHIDLGFPLNKASGATGRVTVTNLHRFILFSFLNPHSFS